MESTHKKVGRPPTGRSTHMLRVQKEVTKEFAERAYFDWLPVLQEYAANCKDTPRYDQLRKLLLELGFAPGEDVYSGKLTPPTSVTSNYEYLPAEVCSVCSYATVSYARDSATLVCDNCTDMARCDDR